MRHGLLPTPPPEESLEIVFEDIRSDKPVFVTPNQQQAPLVEKTKKEVQLKSDQTRRTELETWKRPEQRNSILAPLAAGGKQGSENQNSPEEPWQEEETQTSATISDDGFYQHKKERRPLQLPGFAGAQGPPPIPAFVQDQLPPGVRLGNVTALNTDQHRYYGFNQRLLGRFIPIWGAKVRNALLQWIKENNSPGVSKTWVTTVEVIMDPQGEIIEVQPFRLSGLWSIDSSSIDAFKAIRNVPNPPKEMVDENGYIHLQFQTEVLWIPQPGVRYHGGGPQ